jgi:hypothetical protein
MEHVIDTEGHVGDGVVTSAGYQCLCEAELASPM